MSPSHPRTHHRNPTDDDPSELQGGPDTGSTDVDPVCGMTVTLKPDTRTETFDGKVYHFCSEKCETKFKTDPSSYACQRQSKSEPKGSAKCCHFGVSKIAA